MSARLVLRGRRLAARVAASAESARDLARLERRMPQLVGARSRLTDHIARLEPYFESYISGVSMEVAAISLQLAGFLHLLCEVSLPATIVDIGSGFSSAVFRFYQAAAPHPVEVISVDESTEWLEQTRAFLRACDLPANGTVAWSSFAQQSRDDFDLVLHDAGVPLRSRILPEVVGLPRAGGTIVFQDMQKWAYRSEVSRVAREKRIELFSVRSMTLDRFRRFAAIGIALDGVSRRRLVEEP